ncbi:MAG: SRPBCC family protein [bacterium]|nr:SRPBCC family protein [bacterium]
MKHFIHQQTTTAPKSAIWRVWSDVTNWHQWDTELESASLTGSFGAHAKGTLKPKNSPKSPFVITEYTEGKSFTFTVPMPMAKLHVAHYFTSDKPTTFVHEVTFTGLLGGVFGRILGRGYEKALPNVLKRIKELAENEK